MQLATNTLLHIGGAPFLWWEMPSQDKSKRQFTSNGQKTLSMLFDLQPTPRRGAEAVAEELWNLDVT